MNYGAELLFMWSWQALLLTGAIWIVVRIGRRDSAAERHRYWLMGVLGIAVLPAASALVDALPVVRPAVRPLAYLDPIAIRLGTQGPQVSPSMHTSDPKQTPMPQSWRSRATTVLFPAWMAGVAVCLGRSWRPYWKSRRLRASARRASAGTLPLPLGYSPGVDAPVLMGVLHPMVLLPESITTWAGDEELRAVVLHELAHFERRDHLVNLLQTVLGAIFFFHPAVRYALGQLALERELACDECVLGAGTASSAYAEAILKVAERTIAGRVSCHPAFNTSRKILNRRLTMILNYRSLAPKGSRFAHFARTAALLGLAVVILPQRAATMAQPLAPLRAEPREAPAQHATPLAAAQATEPAPVSGLSGTLQVAQATPQAATRPADGQIAGAICDQSGARIPGVTVQLTNIASGASETVFSGPDGSYTVTSLEAGQYSFEAHLPGFATYRRTLALQPGARVTQDVILQLAGIAVQVEVSTAKPQTAPPAVSNSPVGVPTRIGGVVAAPRLIYSPKPVYPPTARARQIEGDVQLQGVIGADGTIVSLQLDPSRGTGNIALVGAAMEAVKQWRYLPAMLNEAPVEFTTTITVTFRLVDGR